MGLVVTATQEGEVRESQGAQQLKLGLRNVVRLQPNK